MKTGLTIGIVAIIVIVLGALAFILMSNPSIQGTQTNQPNSGDNQITPPSTTTPSQTTTPSTPKTYNIEIKDFAFSPSSLTINKGDTVIWTNKDSVSHPVTSDSGNELNSGTLSQGQTYSHTFSAAETFFYHCSVHPMMKAKIIVQ